MTGAMYAAIAGLKTHMSGLNVIGNNIANVNTVAYKSQRYIFQDAMYTMYSSGSDGTDTKGGQNPSQIGYGSQISTIDLNMTTGSFSPGNDLDCMIDGDGFFLVGDKDVAQVIDAQDPTSFKSLTLTRAGNFTIDAGGYLVDGNGSPVYGFLTVDTTIDGEPIVSDQLVPIRLPRMETVGVDANGEVAEDEEDIVGYESILRYPVDREMDENGEIADDAPVATLRDYTVTTGEGDDATTVELPFAQFDSISIDKTTGRISGTTKETDQWVTIGFLAIGNVTNPNGVTHDGGFYYKCSDGAGDLQVALMGGAADTLYTRAADGSTTSLTYVNGSLVDTEAEDVVLSDKALIGDAGTTALSTGGLEGSNVDLATEISNMIVIQRGYQANTRIITVTDSMLEELVNMKR